MNLALAAAGILAAVAVVATAGVLCWFLVRQLDHMQRIQRATAGLPEVPREKRKPQDPMPDDVRQLIMGWDSPQVRQHLMGQCRELRREGVPWEEVRRLLAVDEGAEA